MQRSKIRYYVPALILMMAMPALAAAQSPASLSGLFACETLADKDDQLACFRTETAKLRETGVPPAPIGTEKVVNDDPETFIPLKKDETPKKRTLTIQSTQSYGQNGYVRFTLQNGEVWQQTDRGNLRLGNANPDKLTIKKGALGSFRARVNDKAPSVRVKRVK